MILLYKIHVYIKRNTYALKEVTYNTMTIATTIPRYDKNQIIIIHDTEIRLIDHLKECRTNKKITKKKISNLIKHNDYWYSQVERDGKNGDDNRQRTIYRNDLVDVISIVQYDASSSQDLEALRSKSEVYLDKIIKALPLKESVKKLELYQIFQPRTNEQQYKLLDSLLSTHEQLLRNTFESLYDNRDKDNFLDALKNTNLALKIDPLFIVFLMGLPYSDFLYEAKQEKLFSLFRDIISIMDDFNTDDDNNLKLSTDYLQVIQNKIIEYTGKTFMEGKKKNYIPIPPEQSNR